MNYFNVGDIVMVVGHLDTRVRSKDTSSAIIGTIDQFLIDQQVSVLLENGDIWVGSTREIVLLKDQM